MVLIKCGECNKVIEDRAKSIYNNEVDAFYCDKSCEKKHIDFLDSQMPTLKFDKDGKSYWDFPKLLLV